jgi:methylenetetrahydrofolate reductase (NADPH)
VLFRRRRALSDPQAAALLRVLRAPTFELIPLKNAMDEAALLPAGATVSVTASPAKGIEATIALSSNSRRTASGPSRTSRPG